MINVSDVVNDPDLTQHFQILRSTDGSFASGSWTDTKQTIDVYGPVIVATAKMLERVPEGDRVDGAMAFYSPVEVKISHNSPQGSAGVSDILVFEGQQYRVASLSVWKESGLWVAIGTRMSGE